ncbi:Bug family tripartite tricarboxylate transporter substrate binding protein [Variovorax beijingensis]|nr:tripartite tricarboxylate transporter substrate binding protein [Variovorax beijingensis]
MRRLQLLAPILAALAVVFSVSPAQSQVPPTIKLVVGYPPGGSVDTLARLLGQALQDSLKTTVVVDNRPGAGGRLAAAQFKRAATDGSEIMIAPNALTTVQSLVYADKLGYSVLDDFVPVAKLASYPFALSVPASSNIRTANDLTAWVKANRAQASYGSSGAGGTSHFAGLMFAKAANIEWDHVPYKGGAPLVTDLVGGHIGAGVDTLIDHIEHARAGRIRIVGIFSQKRYALAPDVPTLAEQGIKGLDIEGWFGAFVPAGMPPATVARLDEAFGKVLADPAFKARLNKLVIETSYLNSSDFRKLQAAELQTWAPVVRNSGFKPD